MATLLLVEHSRVGSPLGFPATVTAVYYPPSPVVPGNPAGVAIYLREGHTLTRAQAESAVFRHNSNMRAAPQAKVGERDVMLGRVVEVINYAGAFPINELDRSRTIREARASGPIDFRYATLNADRAETAGEVVNRRRFDTFARVVRPHMAPPPPPPPEEETRGGIGWLPLLAGAAVAGAAMYYFG